MSLSIDISSLNSASLMGLQTTSILQQTFDTTSSTSSLSDLLLSSAFTDVEAALSNNLSALNTYLASENRLSSDYNLLSNLGGFESYTTTLNLLEAQSSIQQSVFDGIVADLNLEV